MTNSKEMTEEIVIKPDSDDYGLKKLKLFDEMRKQGNLCDVIFLTSGNNRILAHKLMILKASKFCASFILDSKDGGKIPLEIKVESVSSDVVDKIITYMYTGQLSIQLSEVEEMYCGSQIFKLPLIQEKCIDLLCANALVKPATMLSRYPIDQPNSTFCQLWLEVEKRLFNNFAQFVKSEEFVDIPNSHFKHLLLSFLNREERPNAQTLCKALGKWAAKTDFDKRHKIVEWLIKKFEDNPEIERSLMSDIDSVIESEKNSEAAECIDIISDSSSPVKVNPTSPKTKTAKGGGETNGKRPSGIEPALKKRCVDTTTITPVTDPVDIDFQEASMLFIEVQSGENGNKKDLWTFEFQEKRFTKLMAMPSSPVTLEEIVVADSKVYVIGGVHQGSGKTSNLVQVLNLKDSPREWYPAPALLVARKEFATAVFEDYIFVIGGSSIKSSKGALTSVERLNVKKDGGKWEFVSNMEDARVACSAAVLNGFIFVVGGKRQKDSKITWKSVEMYDVSCNVWTKISNMWTPRSGCASISHSDRYLYVFGGENNDGICNSVEVYDIEKDAWCFSACLKQKRKYSSVVNVGGNIYVFGGYDAKSLRINSAEVFDPKMGLWKMFIACGDTITTSFRTVALINKSSLL